MRESPTKVMKLRHAALDRNYGLPVSGRRSNVRLTMRATTASARSITSDGDVSSLTPHENAPDLELLM
jgi:hypothetical protein